MIYCPLRCIQAHDLMASVLGRLFRIASHKVRTQFCATAAVIPARFQAMGLRLFRIDPRRGMCRNKTAVMALERVEARVSFPSA